MRTDRLGGVRGGPCGAFPFPFFLGGIALSSDSSQIVRSLSLTNNKISSAKCCKLTLAPIKYMFMQGIGFAERTSHCFLYLKRELAYRERCLPSTFTTAVCLGLAGTLDQVEKFAAVIGSIIPPGPGWQ